jgi:enoyl-CoA hydratase
MPEVFIGSIPDVGATRFFNMCPGRIGLYLALTGARIGVADAMYCGLFTHFVPQGRFEELTDALAGGQVEAVLARFAGDPGESQLAALRPAIDRRFAGSSVEAIVVALREHEADWSRAALAAMERASPTSLKIVFRQLQRGAGMDIEQALALEYRVIHHLLVGEDFYEGVRSVVIDKDRNPRWQLASLEQVSEAEVERHFESLGAEELA